MSGAAASHGGWKFVVWLSVGIGLIVLAAANARLLYVAAPVRMFPAGLSGGGGDVGIGALCACMRGRGQGRDPSCRDTVARQRRGARGICGGCESIGTMRSRRSHSHKALGLKMPQGKRIKIRSRDVAKATREVGALSQHVPVEVALNGLTARH